MRVESCVVTPELSIPHFTVPEAKALDLDRTLTQVPVCTERIISLSADFGLTEQAIRDAQSAHSGGRDPLRFIQETLSPGEFMEWGERYIAQRSPALTYPDTPVFLAALQEAPALPNVGVTYGTNPLLQVIKVAGAGCSLYIEILDHTDKGPHLDTWWHGNTADFIARDEHEEPIAVYHAASVELIDDSDTSHENLTARCKGARLVRLGEKRKQGQDGPVAEHLRDRVRTISSLGEVSLVRDIQAASCSAANPNEIPHAASFAPAYPAGNAYPGILITPNKSFADLKATLDSLYA